MITVFAEAIDGSVKARAEMVARAKAIFFMHDLLCSMQRENTRWCAAFLKRGTEFSEQAFRLKRAMLMCCR